MHAPANSATATTRAPFARLLPVLLLVVLALIAPACTTHDPSRFDERLRAATFDRYWRALDRSYPFFESKGIDWDATREHYRPRAIDAAERHEFVHILAAMLAELDDLHVSLGLEPYHLADGDRPASTLDVGLVTLDDDILLTAWSPEAAPPPPGPGADPYPELVSVNGAQPTLTMLGPLLTGPAGDTARIELEWSNGTRASWTPTYPWPEDAPAGPTDEPATRAVAVEREPSLPFNRAAWAVREGDVAYMEIRTFSPKRVDLPRRELLEHIEETLRSVLETRALVLDLRGNGGGDSDVLIGTLAHFLEQPATLWVQQRPGHRPAHSGTRRVVKPQRPVYRGRLVLLIGATTGSAAEHFALALQREGRAITVGTRTAGAEAGIKRVAGPDGSELRFGFRRLLQPDGTGLQDVGVLPDIAVPLDRQAIVSLGADRAVEAANARRMVAAFEAIDAGPELDRLRERLGDQVEAWNPDGAGDEP